jgi:hypothetical protein
MRTVQIGVKDFRQNMAELSRKSQKKNWSFLVTRRNKPLWEVKPCFNEQIFLDDTQIAYYKHLEKSLSFWEDDADDNIFKTEN